MKKRSDKLSEILQRLERGIADTYNSEAFVKYLKTLSKFYQYSVCNQLLICWQRPDASQVASYTSWQRNFHRQVRKGERGIQILAPYMREVTTTDANGEEKKEMKMFFKPAHVFDISQTDGEELPEICTPMTGDVRDYATLMPMLCTLTETPVVFDAITSDALGYYDPQQKKIVIRHGMSQRQTIKTILHETAHSLLHYRGSEYEKSDRSTKELQAESVAYAVSSALGIDTSEYSFEYVAAWAKDRDGHQLHDNLRIIHDCACDLILRIENRKENKNENSDC